MKILLVDDEQDILEVLMFTLESQVEADLLTANSGNDAIELIKTDKEVDLIICDYNMNNGSGGDVYRYLLDHKLQIPYVMCSSDSPEDHNVFLDRRYFIGNIVKPAIFDGIEAMLDRYEQYRKNLSSFDGDEINRISIEYTNINFSLLESIDELPGDIFIQVSDEKVLKIFSIGSKVSDLDLDKYKQRGVKKLLVHKNDVKLFVDNICHKIDRLLKRNNHDSGEENLLDVHSVILDTVQSIGFSDQIVRATEKSVEYALNMFKQNKELRSFSKQIFGHKGKFLTKHSVALAYVSCGILKNLSWDSFESRNKLVLASFYHDITIKDLSLNEAHNLDDLRKDEEFFNHPLDAYELIQKLKDFPADVDKIILEHHENPDGSGFPRRITAAQISPLGALFNVSHRIVECIFKNEGETNQEQIIECLAKDVPLTGNFKKIVDAFKQTNFFQI